MGRKKDPYSKTALVKRLARLYGISQATIWSKHKHDKRDYLNKLCDRDELKKLRDEYVKKVREITSLIEQNRAKKDFLLRPYF